MCSSDQPTEPSCASDTAENLKTGATVRFTAIMSCDDMTEAGQMERNGHLVKVFLSTACFEMVSLLICKLDSPFKYSQTLSAQAVMQLPLHPCKSTNASDW